MVLPRVFVRTCHALARCRDAEFDRIFGAACEFGAHEVVDRRELNGFHREKVS